MQILCAEYYFNPSILMLFKGLFPNIVSVLTIFFFALLSNKSVILLTAITDAHSVVIFFFTNHKDFDIHYVIYLAI